MEPCNEGTNSIVKPFAITTMALKKAANVFIDQHRQQLSPFQLELLQSTMERLDAKTLMDLTLLFEP